MSQRRGYFEDYDVGNVLEDVQDWYHIPTLVVLLGFMLWVRLRSWSNFVRDGDVFFSGNDAWYHYRQTQYVVDNWPGTMPFDPWTYFPYGTASGQFGTLFDQLVATAALIVGLGNPSDQTVAMTLLVAPAVMGTLVAVPVYFAGKRLGGRFGGLVSVLILALSSGSFLNRSIVGFSDHQVAEALFQMVAVVAIMIAVSVAEDEMPVWELVVNREWDALRPSAGWATLAGVAMALYIWVWPPALLLVGIFGVFLVIQLNLDYLRGRSPEHVAFVGVIALVVTGLLSFIPLSTFEVTGVDFSFMQPLLAFAVAAGAVFMAWLARAVDDADIDRRAYPAIVFGAIAAAAVLAAVIVPDVFGYIVKNTDRFIGLGGGAQAQTIGEAQPVPLGDLLPRLFGSYGLAWFGAFAGLVALLAGHVRGTEKRAETVFVMIWTVIMLLATMTQVRFGYYLTLPIAVLNAYIIALVAKYVSPTGSLEEIETFQVLTIMAVLILVIAPMIVPMTAGSSTVIERGSGAGPSPGVVGWTDSLDWMESNTPTPGTYGGANNSMDFTETVPRQDDYDYPDGAYGVMSWWDYGHWITQRGGRIPTANPFQQGATEAANFLLAPTEKQAGDVLANVSEDDADAETRYVMIDWKMVNTYSRLSRGKFFAPTIFNESTETSDYYSPVIDVSTGQPRVGYNLKTQRYYESMVNRLWHFHGSARQPRPVVLNYDTIQQGQGQEAKVLPRGDQNPYRVYDSMREAREFAENDSTAQIGGVGPNPPEAVEALDHYRLVYNSNTSAFQPGSPYQRGFRREVTSLSGGVNEFRNSTRTELRGIQSILLGPQSPSPPWTKVFERVPGATIEGTGPENRTVIASVPMELNSANATFRYTQRVETGPDGEFEMTVPYSTTGYENWGTEQGYTDVAVEAAGPYTIRTNVYQNLSSGSSYMYNATTHVSEGKVIGEDDSPVQVDLERTEFGQSQPDGNESTTDETSGDSGTNETSGDDTTGDDTASDGSTDTSTNDSESQTMIAEPAGGAGIVTP
ncbi:dolichyl-diphosphooligosaccharide--protein glycosyltransferase [Halorientalis persicus]|uniref:dolichyl-phosphooligosaccharide-protein glycotransferase n=1 Tax=Halorientalis persicus TaxID=1367881 RepID=A0A1H8R0T2_9EURY|nr:oligosaccharyl transferase, archaeosortase A system-associated [Halorientalis persicus]SEO60075.1 dolichyl-diphosphooligosaccharide--protein glycosyltransferase [Halorientalis persicus]